MYGLNQLLAWLCRQTSEALNWEPAKARLTKVTFIDDMARQMAKLQLMMGNQISRETGLAALGMDARDEARKMIEDQKYTVKLQDEFQKEMEDSSLMQQMAQPQQPGMAPGGAPPRAAPAGASAPAGGDPAAAGGASAPMAGPTAEILSMIPQGDNVPITPQDMVAQSQAVASKLLQLPDSLRTSVMMAIRKQNEAFHGAVKSSLEQIRYNARQQGGQAVMAQQFGQPA